MNALLLRSPSYPLWVDRKLPATTVASEWRVYRSFSLDAVSSGVTLPPFLAIKMARVAFDGAVPNDPFISDPSRWPLGVDSRSDAWLYIPAGARPFAQMSLVKANAGGTSPSSVSVTLEVWLGSDPLTQTVLAESLGGDDVNWKTPNIGFGFSGCWARLQKVSWHYGENLVPGSDTFDITFSFGMVMPGGTDKVLLPVCPPPEYTVSEHPYLSTRNTAGSVLFTNVTSVLNQEGIVKSVRAPVRELPPFAGFMANFATVQPSALRFARLAKGCYSFTLPDSLSDDFRDYSVQTSTGPEPCFRLDSFEYAHHFFFTDMEASTVTNLAISLDWHVEFQTVSCLFPTATALGDPVTWYNVTKAVQDIPCFYENPAHLTALAGWISKAFRAVAPHLYRIGAAGVAAAARQARHELYGAM